MKKNTIINIKKNIIFNYEIKEEIECGVILLPWEVKSIKNYGCSIINSYVFFKKNECWICNMIINFPLASSIEKNNTKREKKILLNKKEINKYKDKIKINGTSIVPSEVYWKNNFIKINLCLVIGKKKQDKRNDEKSKRWKNIKKILSKFK